VRPGQRERPLRGAQATPERSDDSKVPAHPAFLHESGHQGACPTPPLLVRACAMSMAPAAATRAAAASAAACCSAWSRCCSAASRRPTCRSAPRVSASRRQAGPTSMGQHGQMATLRTLKEATLPMLSTPYTNPNHTIAKRGTCGPQRPTWPVNSSASVRACDAVAAPRCASSSAAVSRATSPVSTCATECMLQPAACWAHVHAGGYDAADRACVATSTVTATQATTQAWGRARNWCDRRSQQRQSQKLRLGALNTSQCVSRCRSSCIPSRRPQRRRSLRWWRARLPAPAPRLRSRPRAAPARLSAPARHAPRNT